MNRLMVLVLCVLGLTGCTALQSGTRATFDLAWDVAEKVVEAKMPGIKADLLKGAKGFADEALDESMQYVALKTAEAAQSVVVAAENRTGIDIEKFDLDGNDVITPMEFAEAMAEENRKREQRKQSPLDFGATFWLALAALGFTGGKSAVRAMKKKESINGDI